MLPGYIASAGITVELRRDATVPFTVIEKAIGDGRIVLWISSAAPFWPTESRFDLGSQAGGARPHFAVASGSSTRTMECKSEISMSSPVRFGLP